MAQPSLGTSSAWSLAGDSSASPLPPLHHHRSRRQGLEAASGAAGLRWLEPRRVLHRPDDGLSSLAAGSFSSAAITGDGELYLWGTVLSEDASTALLKQSGVLGAFVPGMALHAMCGCWGVAAGARQGCLVRPGEPNRQACCERSISHNWQFKTRV